MFVAEANFTGSSQMNSAGLFCNGNGKGIHILSGTSSRPLSAMIAVDFWKDHKRLARDLVSMTVG